MAYCEVILLDAPLAIDRPFDYFCEDALLAKVRPGSLVKVPFGSSDRLRDALVLSVKEKTESEKVKPVHSVLDDRFSLSREMLGLCLFLKDYTLCTTGEAVHTVLPPGALADTLNVRVRKVYSLPDAERAREALCATGRSAIRSEGQRTVLSFLLKNTSAEEKILLSEPGVTSAHIGALCRRGLLAVGCIEDYRNPYAAFAAERDTSPIVLSAAQTAAYDTIEWLMGEDSARAALLYGVTGSGKTKVILKAIETCIASGKSAIMLVPEIALTPQTVGIFCRRFGERVAVIHSSLSAGERLDAYRRIRCGAVDLVIGTRSAVFAPLDNLGLIVIDEEHEHTYKSESDPKYHARDVAAYRCGQYHALMLLASATPSVESFYKAKTGAYTLVPLRERYGGAKLPTAVIVDMREELRLGNTSPISQRLADQLSAAYEKEKQAILFLNRRGYNSQVSCKTCGEVITCPHCSVSLTYHTERGGGKMMCHLCGYTAPPPKVCPACGGEKLSFLGFGTQRVEGDLSRFLPDVRVLRMDADTTSQKFSFDRLLEQFRSGEADVLLGTQMVTKGHDFPDVTLVGVILADTSLYVSDFRAAERTFSLLTQVIGRAGRAGAEGCAVIQTYSPDNEIIRLACTQNYDAFYEGEIKLRKELSYPPFCDIVTLTLTSSDEQALLNAAAKFKEKFASKMQGDFASVPLMAYGPFEAGVYKLNEKYRLRTVVKCKLNAASRALFRSLLSEYSGRDGITLTVDLNPLSV